MTARRDLTDEEWEALLRIDRGAPEAPLVPATLFERLTEIGLATLRGGQRRVTDRAKALIRREREDGRISR